MKRLLILLFGVVTYVTFLGTFTYFIGFVENLTPIAIDSPRQGSLGLALIVDVCLVGLFAVQHTIMARKPFKRWIQQYIPPALERSTFVLAATALLALIMWQWQPVGGIVWQVRAPALKGAVYAVYGLGWVLAFAATFSINHFDLFGVRQAWLGYRGRPYTPVPFRDPWLYRIVRHPLYLGLFLGLWGTPTMTATHLVLAATFSAHILFGVRLEERDLIEDHPEYRDYRRQVPMLVPGLTSRAPRGTRKLHRARV